MVVSVCTRSTFWARPEPSSGQGSASGSLGLWQGTKHRRGQGCFWDRTLRGPATGSPDPKAKHSNENFYKPNKQKVKQRLSFSGKMKILFGWISVSQSRYSCTCFHQSQVAWRNLWKSRGNQELRPLKTATDKSEAPVLHQPQWHFKALRAQRNAALSLRPWNVLSSLPPPPSPPKPLIFVSSWSSSRGRGKWVCCSLWKL